MTNESVIGPKLAADLEQTAIRVTLGMRSDDVVLKFLCCQWEAAMQSLPQIPSEERGVTRRLIAHLGAIALTYERLQFDGWRHFIDSAEAILAEHVRCFGEDLQKGLDKPFRSDVH